MENKYPEWTIFEYHNNKYDLCHLHENNYYSTDIRNLCSLCDISPPDYMMFQVKLLGHIIKRSDDVEKHYIFGQVYELDGSRSLKYLPIYLMSMKKKLEHI